MFRLHPSRQLRMVTCNAWTPFYLLNKVTSITKLKLPNMKNNILQFDQGTFMCKSNDSLNGRCPDILQWTKKDIVQRRVLKWKYEMFMGSFIGLKFRPKASFNSETSK